MSASIAKLRADLVFSKRETPEGASFVVKIPATGRFFRLGEAEHAIAGLLDGRTPPDAVRQRAAERLGVELDRPTLDAFVEQLRRQGLLEGGDPARAAPPRRGLARGNVLWLRLKAFDPDRVLGYLASKLEFCFTPLFVVASSALIALAVGVIVSNSGIIGHDLPRLWRVHNFFIAWLLLWGITIAHEFAHGVTCKHFGGEVREMGFLLIYLQPALYCNLSDAWLFPQKSRRLWVTFAGAYFEMIVWALATLAWRLTDRGSWPGNLALLVMVTSGIKTLFNMNPLIKLDGYYLLSDALEIPNLRSRAFSYLAVRVKRVFSPSIEAPDATARERRVFLGYGVLAFCFSWWLLGNVVLGLGRYLVGQYQGWGFIAFAGVFAGVFGGSIGRILPRKIPSIPGSVKLFSALGVVSALALCTRLDLTVSGECTLLPGHNADVRAEVEGIVTEIPVDEGQHVAKGDFLALISDRDYRVKLGMIRADIDEKKAKLKMLEAGPRSEDLEPLRIAVTKAEQRLASAGSESERAKKLYALQILTQADLQSSEAELAVRARELDEARAKLNALSAGSRPEEIEATEAEIAHAETERAQLVEQIARTRIVSPHDGVITTPKPREKVGTYVRPGDLIVEVYAVDTMIAEVAVSEKDIGDVAVGQQATVRLRTFPDRDFTGEVIAIAPAASETPGALGKFVTATVRLENLSGLLKPATTGYTRIYCGRKRTLDVLTRRLRHYVRVEFWSWW